MKKQFFRTVFVPPNDTLEEFNLPSRLTDEIFSKMEKSKINRLLGWGYDNRKSTIIKTLELCEKYHIGYYLQLPMCYEYMATKYCFTNRKPFNELTKEELKDLDNRMIAYINQYRGYKALAGVIFTDECGVLSYPGVIYAKEVFEKAFPDLEFYVNTIGWEMQEVGFWCGSYQQMNNQPKDEDKPFLLKDEYEVTFENRMNFYPIFINELYSKTHFKYLSFDDYPTTNRWNNVNQDTWHISFFEDFSVLRGFADKYDMEMFTYVPVGSWFNDKRELKECEFDLVMHASLLYGCTGFGFFPGFYPVDFEIDNTGRYKNERNGRCGFFDINGNPSHFYSYLLNINKYFDNIENDYLNSQFVGIKGYGKYYNGLTKEEALAIPAGEGIYLGNLPKGYQMDNQHLNVISSTNNVLISEFKRNNKKRFYIVNMASIFKNKINIELDNKEYILYRKSYSKKIKGKLNITLDEGEGIYLKQK